MPSDSVPAGAGRITFRHAQEILDHTRPLEARDRAQFESDLLALAEHTTVAKFRTRARRLREQRHPETIPERHRDAFGKRRVSLEALPDGMSCVSAFLAAEKGQAIFTSLSGAARGAGKAGDGRSMDQLRADIFASVFLDCPADHSVVADSPGTEKPGEVPAVPAVPKAGGPETERSPNRARDGVPPVTPRSRSGRRSRRSRRQKLKTEIMVLIQADTLTGHNEAPAELNGYGPLSPETGKAHVPGGGKLDTLGSGSCDWRDPSRWPPSPGAGGSETVAAGTRRYMPVSRLQRQRPEFRTRPHPSLGMGRRHLPLKPGTPLS